ncbi:hypothetical protein H920_18425 [Fukomys damarensis]|uniref:Uncharacterized protein n=1 Tax=Fukomys damarensis TaxID=885580 RepID=A0A091CMM7_FUKDA|nr:hypothetical protein H920_18425 [Fukomys damarensis]
MLEVSEEEHHRLPVGPVLLLPAILGVPPTQWWNYGKERREELRSEGRVSDRHEDLLWGLLQRTVVVTARSQQ